MKRGPHRAWPKGIVEVPAGRPDPRAEPRTDSNVTQKISREELDAVLKRTKSGTRPIVRSEPNLDDQGYAGPRDSSPQITIVSIDTFEFPLPGPPAEPAEAAEPTDVAPPLVLPASWRAGDDAPASAPAAAKRRAVLARVHITPRVAFVAGVAVIVLVALAAFLGFFAGRVFPGAG